MSTSYLTRALLAASSLIAAAYAQSSVTTTTSSPPSQTSIVPNVVDGYANESAAIVPIDYDLARSIVPANYTIMTGAYESLLPNWPKGKYPVSLMFMQAVEEELALFSLAYETNDTSNGELVVSNLTRVAIRFPFVSRLGSSASIPFRFANVVVIQAPESNIVGSSYLQQSLPGTFDPPLGGYAAVPGCPTGEKAYSTAWNGTDQADGKPPTWKIDIEEKGDITYPPEFWRNVTTQPFFGGGSVPDLCLVYRFDESSLNNPPAFTATVSVKPPYWPREETFKDIHGIHIPAAFSETFLSCESVPGELAKGS
ncbi:MAG: hypothetical protein Q9160_003439 [Pyrenula sp. 1 TL-2023]